MSDSAGVFILIGLMFVGCQVGLGTDHELAEATKGVARAIEHLADAQERNKRCAP